MAASQYHQLSQLRKAKKMTKTILKPAFFQRWKWGLWFAAIYLVVSLPCAVVSLMHSHEYCIPGMIVRFASLPTVYLLFHVFTPYGRQFYLLPHGEVLLFAVVLGLTALLYFGVGQAIGFVVRYMARRAVRHKPGVSS
jgi:hypothetical protein